MAQLLTFSERGPHPVGLVTIAVADTDNPSRVLPTDLWYPAATAYRGHDLEQTESPEHPLAQPHHAVADATPAAGRFPLLAFSHGNSGVRRQSTFLTTHLASWGFVIAAPDHTGNTFAEMQFLDDEERMRAHLEARRNRPRDLRAVIDAVLAGGGDLPQADAACIGAFGHSFGGWTALKTPGLDERVRAVCGLAPAAEPFVGRKAFEPAELPFGREVAALLVAGIDDVLVDIDASVRSLFDRLEAPRAFVGIEGADHFHFCDGVELLHLMHMIRPRDGLTRQLRPYAETLNQERMHRIVRTVVADFFIRALEGGATRFDGSQDTLGELDSAVSRLG